MSPIQHLVSPKLPTALVHNTHVDLPGQDIWLLYLDNVHVIPAKLDVPRFEDALSRALQLYPHAAGQLRCIEGRWSIELTNTAVPVVVEHRLDTSCDSVLNGDWVIQEDLSGVVNQHPMTDNPVNGSAPLLRVKLTFFDRETCIGVSWNHSLGDVNVITRFMHMLSRFYEDLPPAFAPPTFKKHHFPTPSAEAELSSPLYPTRHFDMGEFLEGRKDLQHVRWRFHTADLEDLRSVLCSDKENKKFLSKQDCLDAYIAAVLNYARSSPVQRIANVSSYRHISAPFIDENEASNMLLIVPAVVPTDMTGIATAVRNALIKSREPDCLYILESLKSRHMLEAARSGNLLPYSFDETEILVNSNVLIDWHGSAHFGCAEAIRFYTGGFFKDVLRCFKSNPVKGEDGAWRTCEAIDISIGVPGELKPKILETLSRGMQFMLDHQRVQL